MPFRHARARLSYCISIIGQIRRDLHVRHHNEIGEACEIINEQGTEDIRQLRTVVRAESFKNRAILGYENDDKDQIHDETARQSRSALGIGLTIFGF